MFRARCAALALAASLGLFCGCLNLCPFSLFRHRGAEPAAGDCCEMGAAPACELPGTEAGGPVILPPPQGFVPPAPPGPVNGMPRLAPVPQSQAPVYPYAPQSRIREGRPGDLELVH